MLMYVKEIFFHLLFFSVNWCMESCMELLIDKCTRTAVSFYIRQVLHKRIASNQNDWTAISGVYKSFLSSKYTAFIASRIASHVIHDISTHSMKVCQNKMFQVLIFEEMLQTSRIARCCCFKISGGMSWTS